MKILDLKDNLTLVLISFFAVSSLVILLLGANGVKTNLTAQADNSATITLSPSKGDYKTGETFPVEIKINTNGNEVYGIKATLLNSYSSPVPGLEITDSDNDAKNGIQIQEGSFEGLKIIKNEVLTDQAKKRIKIELVGYADLDKTFKTEEEETLGTINLKLLNESGQESLTFEASETRIISSETNENIVKILNDGFYTIK